MKLKNNSIGPKVVHYIDNDGSRKIIEIESNGVVDIDCDKIINEVEIQNAWISVLDEPISADEKLAKATKDVESYMSESENKSSKKK
jgi:hypothetical protein